VTSSTDRRRPLHVVVVGSGFAGLNAARRLARQARDLPLEVTLVDKNNYHTFQPLLYQVATGGLQPQDIGHSVRALFGSGRFRGNNRTVRVRMGTVVAIDRDQRFVHFADGHQMSYDLLVVAAGAATADYGIDGVAEHAYPLKSLTEAMTLRNHVLKQFEAAALHPEEIREGSLTFVVAGGGPTGVELSGALSELFRVLRRDHPELPHEQIRVILVEMLPTVLPPYAEASQRYTKEALAERDVELRLDTAIERVEEDRVVLAGGEEIRTRTLIWTAGIEASPLATLLEAEQTKGGRVVVDPDLRLPEDRRVFVIGDMAGATGPDGEPLPQLAPVAMQQGKHAADQIVALVTGKPTRPFRYRDRGTMATIGRSDAVIELPFGPKYHGLFAWLSWLALHLLYLVGFRNRIGVLLSWLWNYLTYDEASRLIIEPRDPSEAAKEVRAANPELDE
jgi:NADH dehydrogenase